MEQIYNTVTSYKFYDNQVLERQGTPCRCTGRSTLSDSCLLCSVGMANARVKMQKHRSNWVYFSAKNAGGEMKIGKGGGPEILTESWMLSGVPY